MGTLTGFENFYLNETSADVHFICQSDDRQSDIRVPVHKVLLGAKSVPFQTMFYGALPEIGDILLPDVTATAFKEFLHLFYHSKTEISLANINEVVDLSKKYQLDYGLSTCSDFLKSNLSTDNFITFYEMALLYELTELKSFCEISASILLTEEIVIQFTRNELKYILQIKPLYVDMNLADVCMKWARIRCQQRQIDPENMYNVLQEIGDLVECLDFVSMPQDKMQKALNMFDAVLTKDTYKTIAGFLMERSTPLDVNKVMWCAEERVTNKRYIESTEMMTVISNKKITLRAVGLAPVYWEDTNNIGQDIYGHLLILKDKPSNGSDYTVLLRESFSIVPYEDEDEEEKMVHLHRFASSVMFEPDQMYKIQVHLRIRNKNEIYTYSKTDENGKHTYNFASGNPTIILFEGESTIASLGVGIEYIDPGNERGLNRRMH